MSWRPLVVIADPHPGTRELLEDIFVQEFGAFVMLLRDPSELGPALLESVPDLVVCEIGRDRIGDVAAIAELKKKVPSVPFLVLSAYGVQREEIEDRTNANAILGKPFEIEDLIKTARGLMDQGLPTP